jgi:hypothetical protein
MGLPPSVQPTTLCSGLTQRLGSSSRELSAAVAIRACSLLGELLLLDSALALLGLRLENLLITMQQSSFFWASKAKMALVTADPPTCWVSSSELTSGTSGTVSTEFKRIYLLFLMVEVPDEVSNT